MRKSSVELVEDLTFSNRAVVARVRIGGGTAIVKQPRHADALAHELAAFANLPREARPEMLANGDGFVVMEDLGEGPSLADVLLGNDRVKAESSPYGLLVTFAAYSGLRAGEIGGLRVGRLDLLRGRVDVVEALKDTNGRSSFGPTKNHANRTVRLPRFLCDQLGAHLADRPHAPADLVFTGPMGGPLQHRTFYRRHFRPAVAAAGLPAALRFHDLRHTAAALLIAQGAHPRAIMERLGHSSITITLNVYGHLFPNLDEALTDGLEATYRQATEAALAAKSSRSCGADVVQQLHPATQPGV